MQKEGGPGGRNVSSFLQEEPPLLELRFGLFYHFAACYMFFAPLHARNGHVATIRRDLRHSELRKKLDVCVCVPVDCLRRLIQTFSQ